MNTRNRDDILVSALNRQKIVAANLTVQSLGRDAILSFHWIALRRLRRQGVFIQDEAAELDRRLSGIFPRLCGLRITIDESAHGRRWVRLVQFRVASDELEYMMNLQPIAVRSCA